MKECEVFMNSDEAGSRSHTGERCICVAVKGDQSDAEAMATYPDPMHTLTP